MLKPPRLEAEIYLLPSGNMNSGWCYFIPFFFIWNQNQRIIMPSHYDCPLRYCIKIPLCRIPYYVINFGQVKGSQLGPVLHIISPRDGKFLRDVQIRLQVLS